MRIKNQRTIVVFLLILSLFAIAGTSMYPSEINALISEQFSKKSTVNSCSEFLPDTVDHMNISGLSKKIDIRTVEREKNISKSKKNSSKYVARVDVFSQFKCKRVKVKVMADGVVVEKWVKTCKNRRNGSWGQ